MSMIVTAALAIAGLASQAPAVTEHENALFKKNIGLYLSRDSWNDSLAYLHGHFLMVPLHAAFLLDQKDWQSQFDAQYKRLVDVPRDKLCKNPLSRLQYLYTATRFLALSAKTGRKSETNAPLTTYLTDEITDRWLNQDAIGFDVANFNGVKQRVEHKLTLINPKLSYYRAITDEEAFLFAEAADLIYVEKKTGVRNPKNDVLREIVKTGAQVFRDRSEFTNQGGWLFDIGAWADHPDLAFSGNSEISPGMSKRKVENITMDTSHFHRFSLFVNSLRDANEPGSADYKFYEKIRGGLVKQLIGTVLQKPDSKFEGYRLTNFMNGMNGVYRYQSAAGALKNTGYGPYQLSGTFLIGWWSFLGDSQVNKAYAEIAKTFPLSENVLKTYQGPTYVEPPRKVKSWYDNGLAELFSSLGAKMPPFTRAAPDKGVAKKNPVRKAVIKPKPVVKATTKKKRRMISYNVFGYTIKFQ